MRTLTKLELAAFKKAFSNIQRVSVTDAKSITEIKADGEKLPMVYIDLAQEFGGITGLQGLCCPLNYEEGLQRFINFCFANRLQPRRFEYNGLLSVDKYKGPIIENTYVSRGGEYE